MGPFEVASVVSILPPARSADPRRTQGGAVVDINRLLKGVIVLATHALGVISVACALRFWSQADPSGSTAEAIYGAAVERTLLSMSTPWWWQS